MAKKKKDDEKFPLEEAGEVTPKGARGFDAPVDHKTNHAKRLAEVIANPKLSLAIATILVNQNSRSITAIESLVDKKTKE